jgi:hypothetical protein
MGTFRLRRRGLAVTLLAVCAGVSAGVPAAQADEGTWAAAAGIQSRFGVAATTAPDGAIYALGGMSGAGTLAVAQVYSPATKTWSALPAMAHARFGAAAAASGGVVYVLGGSNADGGSSPDDGVLALVEKISGPAGTWVASEPMSSRRYALGAATDALGRIYAVGGNNGNVAVRSVERYDPGTGLWNAVAQMSTVREWPAVAAGKDGRIYAIGGNDASGALQSAEVYDPAANTWTAIASMATARTAASAAMAPDGRIVVTGGTAADGAVLATGEVYNPATNAWTAVTPMPRPRAYGASTQAPGGRIFVLGGSTGASTVGAVDALQLVDTTRPVLTSVTIKDGSAATSSGVVTVKLVATDTPSGPSLMRVSSKPPVDCANGCKMSSLNRTGPYSPSFSWDLTDPAWGGTAGDGTKQVWVQVVDAAGNASAIRGDTIVLDTTTPRITSAPATSLAAGTTLQTGVVPVKALWAGADDTGGIIRYDVEWRQGAGAFASIPRANVASTTVLSSYPRGCSCVVRVNAQDAAGHVSDWAASPQFVPTVTQERSALVTYRGSWTAGTNASHDGGRVRYATVAGASARFDFTGRAVAWVAPTSNTRGSATVYVDGVKTATVSLYSRTQQYRRLVFARNWPEAGAHRIVIKVDGTKGRPRVDLDAFVVLN